MVAKKPDIKLGDAAGGMPACLADNAALQGQVAQLEADNLALQKAIQDGDTALQGQLNENAALRAELEAIKSDEVELKRQLTECQAELDAKKADEVELQGQLDECTVSLSTCLGTCPG